MIHLEPIEHLVSIELGGPVRILITRDASAVFGWWRPDPDSGIEAMHGLDGWTCSIFRNTGGLRSSELILAAELELLATDTAPCGPDGLLTWVWPRKLQPRATHHNPGWCFQVSGWTRDRWNACGKGKARSKRLLRKPIALAGVPACRWEPSCC